MQKGIVYYRKFRLNMMSVKTIYGRIEILRWLKITSHIQTKEIVKVVDRNEYNQLQTQQNQEIKTYIISGRLTNAIKSNIHVSILLHRRAETS